MFSITTIASSMTMPTESVSANMVIELSVKPSYQISPNVEMMEVGMAIAAITVERKFQRKKATTSAAKIEPRTRCSLTVAIDALMYSEESRTTRTSYPGVMVGVVSASRLRTA